jgi:hypothetical protein
MEKDFNDMSYAEQRSWLMDKAFPKKDPNASLSWIEEGKLKINPVFHKVKQTVKTLLKLLLKKTHRQLKMRGGDQELQVLKGINLNL